MDDNSIFRLRREAIETLKKSLIECLAIESEAEQRLGLAEMAIWRYRDDATVISDDDSAVEAFAAWLPEGRRQVMTAQSALDRAVVDTICARAALACAQAALSAVTAFETIR